MHYDCGAYVAVWWKPRDSREAKPLSFLKKLQIVFYKKKAKKIFKKTLVDFVLEMY